MQSLEGRGHELNKSYFKKSGQGLGAYRLPIWGLASDRVASRSLNLALDLCRHALTLHGLINDQNISPSNLH